MKMRSRTFVWPVLAALAFNLTGTGQADVVTDWNETTLATQAAVPGGVRTPPAGRALAMVHVAIFDSVNAIDRKYTPYAVAALADPNSSPEAAAAATAHAVLVSQYPSRQPNLDAAYTASLALIPNGSSKTEGVSVGESVSALILALRGADGSAITVPHTLPPGPGVYQPDPAALFVAWGSVAPFALKSGSQFRALTNLRERTGDYSLLLKEPPGSSRVLTVAIPQYVKQPIFFSSEKSAGLNGE